MKKIINWLIHKLGGYSEKEYLEHRIKCEAVSNAHEKVLQWFSQPIVSIQARGERYSVAVTVDLRDNVPIERIKRDMCRRMADKIFDDNLIAFDVEDDEACGGKLYRGTMTFLLPPGFGSEARERIY